MIELIIVTSLMLVMRLLWTKLISSTKVEYPDVLDPPLKKADEFNSIVLYSSILFILLLILVVLIPNL